MHLLLPHCNTSMSAFVSWCWLCFKSTNETTPTSSGLVSWNILTFTVFPASVQSPAISSKPLNPQTNFWRPWHHRTSHSSWTVQGAELAFRGPWTLQVDIPPDCGGFRSEMVIIWAMVNTHYMVDGHPIHNKDPYNGYYKSLWTIGWLAPINGY